MLLRNPAGDYFVRMEIDDSDGGLGPETDVETAAIFVEAAGVGKAVVVASLEEMKIGAFLGGGDVGIVLGRFGVEQGRGVGLEQDFGGNGSAFQIEYGDAITPDVGD